MSQRCKKVIVTDRETIERGLVVRSSYVVISIRDHGTPKARIPKPTAMRGVLHLAFHDAEPTDNFKLPPDVKAMTRRQSCQVWEFVAKHAGEVGAIVVHCHQGMSRSPAIAAAIAHDLGLDPEPFFLRHMPNKYVYELMLQTRPDCKSQSAMVKH